MPFLDLPGALGNNRLAKCRDSGATGHVDGTGTRGCDGGMDIEPKGTVKGERLKNACVAAASLLVLFAVLEVAARVYLMQFADEERFYRYASIDQVEIAGQRFRTSPFSK